MKQQKVRCEQCYLKQINSNNTLINIYNFDLDFPGVYKYIIHLLWYVNKSSHVIFKNQPY